MSPRSSTLLALAGVLLAGIPLPALTSARPALPMENARQEQRAAATCSAYLSVHFSGMPTSLIIRHEGQELTRMPADAAGASPWETELELPTSATLELEVEAQWNDGPHTQAVTLTLEPEQLPQRQSTQWTTPGSNHLHNAFIFKW